MPKSKSVSLSEIARQSGYSKMTVSLALKQHPRIPSKTREKIEKLANELGYKPDPSIAKAMSQIRKVQEGTRHYPIAYLTSGEIKDHWRTSPTHLAYFEGAKARARQFGYYLEEFWINGPNMRLKRLSDIIWNRGVEGIIVAPIDDLINSETKRHLRRFEWNKFVSVTVSESLLEPDLNRVIHDHYDSMQMVMQQLRDKGYSRIGLCIREHYDFAVNHKWQAAYRVAQASHSDLAEIPPLIERDLDGVLIRQWIDKHDIEVVIGASLKFVENMKDTGYKLGKELACVHMDLESLNGTYDWLSGVNQNSEFMGATAVDSLIGSIHQNSFGVPETSILSEVKGKWIDNASTPKRSELSPRRLHEVGSKRK